MNTVKEFTPVLMYVDHERIESTMKSAKGFEEKINSKFREVEEFLEEKLTDQQLRSLASGGIRYVDELLNERFQFKNASKEFNLEAMGKTAAYKDLEISLRSSTGWITAYDYTIEEGTAFLSQSGQNTIVEANTHYTKNEAQTEAFKLAERMVKDLNKAIKKGWIKGIDFTDIEKGNKLVKSGQNEFIPNFRNIRAMNEAGQVRI